MRQRRSLEPTGLYRSDGNRPDGATVVPWKGGKVLVWDATFPDTLAQSHASLAAREAGAVAEHRKRQKYAYMEGSHIFTLVAAETLGVSGSDARVLFRDIAHRITATTQDPLAHQYLIQRVAVGGTFNDL